MKYTRYDIKRKRNNNFIFTITLISTLVFALLIGTLISKIIFRDSNFNLDKEVVKNTESSSSESSAVDEKEVTKTGIKYIAIQGGLFSKSEYLEEAKKRLSDYGIPFTIPEEKGTRVIVGIYSEEQAQNVIKTLNDNGIDNSKINFQVNFIKDDACDEIIKELLNAEIDILTKVSDKNTKSYKVSDLKAWCEENAKKAEGSSKNYDILNEIKTHINGMPDELGKDKVAEYYVFIYNTLKKLTNV